MKTEEIIVHHISFDVLTAVPKYSSHLKSQSRTFPMTETMSLEHAYKTTTEMATPISQTHF